MAHEPDSPVDTLWQEYCGVFRGFDDLTLARWMAQTLSQIEGRGWRMSHPLLGAYRLAATVAHDRQIWFKRLVTVPAAYSEAPCCRAPLLPLFTREVLESGLLCVHCNGILVPFDELPAELDPLIRGWAEEYAPLHAVAHWDERQQKSVPDYDRAYEEAATKAETLLAFAGHQLLPKLLELYPTIVWEDQDDCLEVRPEDIRL
jgi:hypothetical protein